MIVRHRLTPLILAAVAAAALVPATGALGAPGTDARRATQVQPTTQTGLRGVIAVEVGRVKLRATPPSPSEAFLRGLDTRLKKANPDVPVDGPPAGPYDTGLPTSVPQDVTPADPTPPVVGAPTVGGGGVAGRPPGSVGGGPVVRGAQWAHARTTAASDFRVFRRTPVLTGSAVVSSGGTVSTSSTNEPTVSNDRNALFFTGNWYTAWSENGGITWSYIDPAVDIGTRAGGFCCDQVTISVPRDGFNMVLWNLQYSRDANGNNAIRILRFNGRSDVGSLSYCSWTIAPSWAGYGANRWFDFEILAASEDWLYITSNVFDTSNPAAFQGSQVIRLNLDDLEDCVDARATRWSRSEYHVRSVEGAGSTMYMGAIADSNTLRLFSVADSSNTLSTVDRDVASFNSSSNLTTDAADATCTAPDGTNPCGRFLGDINAGYRSGSEVGLLWTQDINTSAGLPFPSTRVARFRTSDLTLTGGTTIWNSNYAWALPTVTVNSRGDKGGTVQVLGGTQNTQTQAFLIDSITPNWNPLPNATVRVGTNGPAGNRWGDYFGIQPMRGCSQTFLAAYAYMSGGTANANTVGESAWFGREGDGCPDLIVPSLSLTIPSGLKGGGSVSAADTTQNIGGWTMPASETAFYLSRNNSVGSSDTRVGERAVGSLAAGAQSAGTTAVSLPGYAWGSYYLIACADDGDPTDEVSDTNNCRASSAFSVTLNVGFLISVSKPKITEFRMADVASQLRAGAAVRFTISGAITGGKAVRTPIYVFLSYGKQLGPEAIRIGRLPIPVPQVTKPPAPRVSGRWTFVSSDAGGLVRIPKRLAPGQYRVWACLGGEPDPALCQPLAQTLQVPQGKSTPAVRSSQQHPDFVWGSHRGTS